MANLWMTPSYTTRTWAYTTLPDVGDTVRYMNDGFDATVTHIRSTRVVLSDGTIYRRRVEARRVWAWIVSHIPRRTTSSSPEMSHSSLAQEESAKPTRSTEHSPTPRPLRPLSPYVMEVNLLA